MFPGCFPLPSRGQAPFHAALQDAGLVFGTGKLLDRMQPGKEGQDGAAAAPQGRGSCVGTTRSVLEMHTADANENLAGEHPGNAAALAGNSWFSRLNEDAWKAEVLRHGTRRQMCAGKREQR